MIGLGVLVIIGLLIVSRSVERQMKIRAQGGDPDSQRRFDALESEVASLRQELTEAQERLDYAERILTQQRPQQLGK
jgi:hypothetical protein